jgi:serine/threonine protein kinase
MADENRDGEAAVKTEANDVGICPTCGLALTQLGPDGECLRCVMSWAFAPEQDVATSLRYGHFEVELDDAGIPVALGAGAMAVTYRARDTTLNSVVALKVIGRNLADNPMARTRFLREARAAAQINHPNVARVIHYGEQDGECFYAMELVEGETLERRVQRTGPLPVSQALEIIEQATRALAAAETCGVVHRDIKPSNVMIESDASGGVLVKIIDYGVAKVLAGQIDPSEQTQIGFIGTPAFASPEQFGGPGNTSVDGRSDIYSLGATLWFLLTGRTPVSGKTPGEIQASHQKLPIDQLKAARIPAAIVELLKRMLAADPAKRPQSARDLLEEIHRVYLRFEPRASLRRKRFLVAAAAAAFVIALTAIGFVLYKQARAPAPEERSIAVLPFENLSSDKDNAFFAEGIQDEILTKLSKIGALKVISRTSTASYRPKPQNLREIAQQLGVANILEGTVQRAGNTVHVNVQLIRGATDQHLWAESYTRSLNDVFGVQVEIAKTIASQLQAELSANEKSAVERRTTTNLSAFDAYSRARTLVTTSLYSLAQEKDMLQAVTYLNDAVAQDPLFFEAYCELATAHDRLYADATGTNRTPERLAQAESALQNAARLRPDAPETHLVRAFHLYYGRRDYHGALAELEKARSALTNDPRLHMLTGYILRRQGKAEEGARELERAVAIDPRNTSLLEQLIYSYGTLFRYADQAATMDRVLAITPDDALVRLARADVFRSWKADTKPLHERLERIRAEHPDLIGDFANVWFDLALFERDPASAEQALAALGDQPWIQDNAVVLGRRFAEGTLARAMGDAAKATEAFTTARLEQEKMVADAPDYGPAVCVLGLIDAALGKKELALEEGRRAIELMPEEKDALNGQKMKLYFCLIAAWVDEKDLALQMLAADGAKPGWAFLTSYGDLKLHPFWDPLRGDPRFEKIVQRLAPSL